MDERMYELAKAYYEQYGILAYLKGDPQNVHKELFDYIKELRERNEQGLVDAETKSKMNKVGMTWTKEEERNVRWNFCYNVVKQYYQLYGTLAMPSKCEIKGFSLPQWISEQKRFYEKGTLSIGRAEKLAAIGMEWDAKEKSDHISIDESAIAYYVSKVRPDAISSYTPDWLNGKELDIYIPSLNIGIEFDGIHHKNPKTFRKDLEKNELCRKNGVTLIRVRTPGLPKMTPNKDLQIIQASGSSRKQQEATIRNVLLMLRVQEKDMPVIDTLGDKYAISSIAAEAKSFVPQYMMAAKHFFQDNGHLFVKQNYKDPTGINLGKWIHDVRANRDFLTERQINALDDIGMVWTEVNKEKWIFNFDKATTYERIPEHATTVDGKSLKEWFEEELSDYKQGMVFSDYKLEKFNTWEKEKKEKEAAKTVSNKTYNKHRSSDEPER